MMDCGLDMIGMRHSEAFGSLVFVCVEAALAMHGLWRTFNAEHTETPLSTEGRSARCESQVDP